MTINVFSKSNKDVQEIKKDLSSLNKKHLLFSNKIAKSYNKLHKRINCKNCGKKLPKKYDFLSFSVKYKICRKCNHLNGAQEETQSFFYKNYVSESNLSKFYKKDLKKRLNKIYIPKVKFLIKNLRLDNKKLSVLDIGCGAGLFICSLNRLKIKSKGLDISPNLISIGKNQLGIKNIFSKTEKEIITEIENTKFNCVSMINVLEHVLNPNHFLEAIKSNKNIKYFFINVPLFGFSSMFQSFFPNVFPRQLGGLHTHLYSVKSLEFICNKYKFKSLANWWFGQDGIDLKRSVINQSIFLNSSKYYNNYLSNCINTIEEKFQNLIDESKYCSEVHMVLKKK
jgi:SAM-dependent methyltransferase